MWAIFCSSSWLGGFDTRPPPPVEMANNRATQRHPRLVKLGECALAIDQIKHANTGAVRARAVDVFRPVVGQTPWQEQYSGEVRGCPAMRVPPARWPLTCAPANLAPVQEFGTNARHTHSGVLESTANMIFAQSPEAFAALNGMEHRLRDLYKISELGSPDACFKHFKADVASLDIHCASINASAHFAGAAALPPRAGVLALDARVAFTLSTAAALPSPRHVSARVHARRMPARVGTAARAAAVASRSTRRPPRGERPAVAVHHGGVRRADGERVLLTRPRRVTCAGVTRETFVAPDRRPRDAIQQVRLFPPSSRPLPALPAPLPLASRSCPTARAAARLPPQLASPISPHPRAPRAAAQACAFHELCLSLWFVSLVFYRIASVRSISGTSTASVLASSRTAILATTTSRRGRR